MENALMVGLTRQMTLRRQLDVTANNIANMSTAGFKVEKVLLRRVDGGAASHADGPHQISFVQDWGITRNFSDGVAESTGSPLHLSLVGRGFFAIETPEGERYTRDGRFTLDDAGTLTTPDGMAVLDVTGAPIIMNTQGQSPVIKQDGSVQVDGQEIARVKIADFASLGVLNKAGNGRFSVPDDVEVLIVQDPKILQGHLESSNVVPIAEITRMIEISRAYQSTSNMLNQEETLSRRTIERLGSVR